MNKKNFILFFLFLGVLFVFLILFDAFVFKDGNPDSGGNSVAGPEDLEDLVPELVPALENSALDIPKETQREKYRIAPRLTYHGALFGDIPGLPGSKNARTGILANIDTRKVLWAKKPRQAVPIASMTKMMTALLAFEAVAEPENGIDLHTPVQVTRGAMDIGGSQVYLDVRETFTLGELLKTIMIVSANDSAQLVAEFIGDGNSALFVEKMNAKARQMGLLSTSFTNPHGLPEKKGSDNVSCCESLVYLAERLMEYPLAVKWASTWLDYIRQNTSKPFQLRSHNRLINTCKGVNGIKTGFIRRAGFCVTASCSRGGKRMVAVVTGFPSQKSRDEFVRKLLDWGYAETAYQTVPK